MPTDIYIKSPGDDNFTSRQTQVFTELDQFGQGIEMLLNTVKGEVLGYPDMGCNLDAFLWNPYVSNGDISTHITSQIQTYLPEYASRIPFEVQVEFIKGDIVDGIFINIQVDGIDLLGLVKRP